MILYHFTSQHGLIGMVKSGKIKSSFTIVESDAVLNKGQVYFISTTRTRHNAFGQDHMASILELDGTKLKQKYKTAPVDYWQDPKYSEAEERIMTNVASIPLWPYVKTVSINLEYFKDVSELRKVVIKCKTHKKPVYLYRTGKDMKQAAPHKRINLTEVDLSIMKPRDKAFYPASRERPYLVPYLALFHAIGTPRIKKVAEQPAVRNLIRMINDYMRYDGVVQVENMISNEINTAMARSERSYAQATSLLNIMTKRKQTLRQAAQALADAVADL